jgi:hypothetical protein
MSIEPNAAAPSLPLSLSQKRKRKRKNTMNVGEYVLMGNLLLSSGYTLMLNFTLYSELSTLFKN